MKDDTLRGKFSTQSSFVTYLNILQSITLCLHLFMLNVQSVYGLNMAATTAMKKEGRTYNYFAFGSNMCMTTFDFFVGVTKNQIYEIKASSTMTALRNLNPIASSAAILPQHRLAFNVPGTVLVEPSWASVEPIVNTSTELIDSASPVVHGVLYKLSEHDFNKVCESEGVPFAYQLHRCRVIPYVGDGNNAGQLALDLQIMNMVDQKDQGLGRKSVGVQAFTLRAGRKRWRDTKTDIAPSQSYLNVLIRGAKEFKLDKEYMNMLEEYPAGRTIVGDGIAEVMLTFAEISQKMKQS